MITRLAVVGVGLIGGSIALAARERRLAAQVVGVGPDADALKRAQDLGAIDSFTTDLAEGVTGADLVILAAPVPQILQILTQLPSLLVPGAVVTDVGSVKGAVAQAGATALGSAFVPGHPMAGSERGGVEAANANLFLEAVWALTPTPETGETALQTVRTFAQALGARVLVLEPDAHDHAVAVTSHLPHVLAYALAAQAGETAQTISCLFDLAAGSFTAATRVAGSSPEMWRDIALTNREHLLPVLRAYQNELQRVIAALEAEDRAAIQEAFQRGYDAKSDSLRSSH